MYEPSKVMDFLDGELGAEPKKKKKKKKFGAKLKKGLKAVASGGLSLAAPALKKTKVGKKIVKGLKAVATGGLSLVAGKDRVIKPSKKSKAPKPSVADMASEVQPESSKAPAEAVEQMTEAIMETTAGDMPSKDALAKLVAAKLVAKLGPPLNAANKTLAKFELQKQATYEHKKLMSDADFRRKVLGYIAGKAKQGNCACKRTLRNLG